jgi:hypothetical protein
MKTIFVLTKPEQRVVIVVMAVLVAAALATHYREKWRDSGGSPTSPAPSFTPVVSSPERDDGERNDGP